MENQFTFKKQYTKTQTSLITKAMLIAGAFFAVIAAGSFGMMKAFHGVATYGTMNLWLPIMLLMLLGNMVISMFWFSAMMKEKAGGFVALAFILYSAMMSTVFGYLFALIQNITNNALNYMFTAFGVTGLIFLFAALMAKITSINGVFTMGKLIAGTSVAMGILMIVFLILGIVGIASLNPGVIRASDGIWFLCMMGMAFVTFLYVVIDIWQISKTSEFVSYGMADQVPSAFVWYCGYKLLVDLINILLIVIVFMLRFARRAD